MGRRAVFQVVTGRTYFRSIAVTLCCFLFSSPADQRHHLAPLRMVSLRMVSQSVARPECQEL